LLGLRGAKSFGYHTFSLDVGNASQFNGELLSLERWSIFRACQSGILRFKSHPKKGQWNLHFRDDSIVASSSRLSVPAQPSFLPFAMSKIHITITCFGVHIFFHLSSQ
jgi:hypothetical protein